MLRYNYFRVIGVLWFSCISRIRFRVTRRWEKSFSKVIQRISLVEWNTCFFFAKYLARNLFHFLPRGGKISAGGDYLFNYQDLPRGSLFTAGITSTCLYLYLEKYSWFNNGNNGHSWKNVACSSNIMKQCFYNSSLFIVSHLWLTKREKSPQ